MTETTTTDVVVAEQSDLVAHEQDSWAPQTAALVKLQQEAELLDVAYKMAWKLSKTTVVPQRYQQSYIPKGKNTPQGEVAAANLAAAIVYGSELGLTVLQSAQNVFDVHGQPAVYARTMVAQVRQWIDRRIAQGRTSADPEVGDSVWEVSATATNVVWAARRDGRTASSEWTLPRAQVAGFTKNDKYQAQPIEMLRAKAMTEVCRILFQDVLLGMTYSVEELQLGQGVTLQRVVSSRAGRGVAGLEASIAADRAAEVTAEVTPDPQPEPAPETPAEPTPEPTLAEPTPAPAPEVDVPQQRLNSQGEVAASQQELEQIRDLLTADKYDLRSKTGLADALAFVGAAIAREIESLADLSTTDAQKVADVFTESEPHLTKEQ